MQTPVSSNAAYRGVILIQTRGNASNYVAGQLLAQKTLARFVESKPLLPEMVSLAGGAAHHSANMIADLQVDSRRMRHNLEATNGLIYAEAVAFKLAEKIGKPAAHELLKSASKRALECRKHLAEVLALDPKVTQHFPTDELKGFFDPQQYLGSAQLFIDAVLNSYTVRQQQRAVH